MTWTANKRMAAIAGTVFVLDQITKFLVLRLLGPGQEKVVVNGFFKFVHWGNTGAAWSLLNDNNMLLAIISMVALAGLIIWRNHFEIKTVLGQCSLGLIIGGILGNLFDRLHPLRHHVIDFLRFYMYRRNGEEIGFPAFNVADSAICVGVALLVIASWLQESQSQQQPNR